MGTNPLHQPPWVDPPGGGNDNGNGGGNDGMVDVSIGMCDCSDEAPASGLFNVWFTLTNHEDQTVTTDVDVRLITVVDGSVRSNTRTILPDESVPPGSTEYGVTVDSSEYPSSNQEGAQDVDILVEDDWCHAGAVSLEEGNDPVDPINNDDGDEDEHMVTISDCWSPDVAISGEPFQMGFTVTNTGDETVTPWFDIYIDDEWQRGGSLVSIAPGESLEHVEHVTWGSPGDEGGPFDVTVEIQPEDGFGVTDSCHAGTIQFSTDDNGVDDPVNGGFDKRLLLGAAAVGAGLILLAGDDDE